MDSGGIAAANEVATAARGSTIVSAWNDWSQSTNADNRCRVACSINLQAGAAHAWTTQQLLRPAQTVASDIEYDPTTTCDPRSGRFWIAGISRSQASTVFRVFVTCKEPGATAFPTPAIAVNSDAAPGSMIEPDRPTLVWGVDPAAPADPQRYMLYLVYTDASGPGAGNTCMVVSTDGGNSWSGPRVVADTDEEVTQPAVDRLGTLYIVYSKKGTPGQVLSRRSTDGGATFSAAMLVAAPHSVFITDSTGGFFPGLIKVYYYPAVAIDPSSDALCVVYEDVAAQDANGDYAVNLFFTRSVNGGQTWSSPLQLGAGVAQTPSADRFHPALTVGPNGRLNLIYYDTGRGQLHDSSDSLSTMLDAYYAYSDNQGAAWTYVPLTSAPFDAAEDGLNRGNTFIGDYIGISTSGSRTYPCYTATLPGGAYGDANIYSHTIVDPLGDVNNDCVVDLTDLAIIAANAGHILSGASLDDGDTDFDGDVDILDFLNAASNLGKRCPPAAEIQPGLSEISTEDDGDAP